MEYETSDLLKSQICTQKQLESEMFQTWVVRLGEKPGHLHRKVWEYCFITQALYERNLLKPNVKGLGFAVGTEPMASLFCSLGASIYATDLFPELAKKQGWVDSNQHASGLATLNSRKLCSETVFRKNCTFKNVDMNHIPDDLKNFDFIWSSCSLEHLGSLKHGEDFIYNSMNCLKPGGFAVHTTEYNMSSNFFTVKTGGTVLYRKKDIQKIVRNLKEQGHTIEIDFSSGKLPADNYIDVAPFSHNPHLKLRLGKFVITSIGLIIQKAK